MPEMILNDQEEYCGKYILQFIKDRELDAVIFRKKYIDIINHAKLLGEHQKIPKERLIFLTIYCVGQYLFQKSPKIAEAYHEELGRCIDQKSFILIPNVDTSKNKFIPDSWNETWELMLF